MKPEKDWLSFALLALTVLGMALVAPSSLADLAPGTRHA